jgi:hypothetical protein
MAKRIILPGKSYAKKVKLLVCKQRVFPGQLKGMSTIENISLALGTGQQSTSSSD